MKRILILITIALAFGASDAGAQNWNEWFKQKKTQKRYLVKQIALFQVYLGHVKKGVKIVQKGLRTIENVKNGDFNLHRDFFSALNNVNPHISNSAKVADIIAYQIFIMRQFGEINRYCRNNDQFTAEEVRYVADVYANLLFLCDTNLSELLTIIRPDKTKMTDDERLMRIDVIHEDMLDKHAFVQAFAQDARMIAHEREREQRELDMIQAYHGLP